MGKYLDETGLSHFMGLIKTALSGKANSSHNHAAGDVNTGTFDIGRIPTGTSGTTVALGNHTHSGYISSTATQSANKVLAGPSSGSAAAPTWRSLVVADLPTGTTASTVALGNHTHSGYAASSHTHDAGDVTTGTFDIGRIPTGTTSTTVAKGNHTHSGYASTSDLADYLPLAGGTLTGHLYMASKYVYLTSSNIDITSPPSSGTSGNSRIYMRDKNNTVIAQFCPYISTSGKYGTQFGTSNNWVYMTTDGSDAAVSFTSAAAWRTGLGLGGAATMNTGTSGTTVALGNHTHNYVSSTATHSANYVFAGPASGSAAAGAWRKLVVADLPTGTSASTVALGNHTHVNSYFHPAQSATSVAIGNTSAYSWLIILFRTNSTAYAQVQKGALTSPLNSTVVYINKASSGTFYASLIGGHQVSTSEMQIRLGVATISCGTSGTVTVSKQMYCNISTSSQAVAANTDFALVGVIGVYGTS